MTLYCDAVFERGFGLGNRLFPWARARIFASANGVPMLAPRWVSPRIRPLFRGEAQARAFPRQVLLIGQLKPRPGDVTGLKRLLIERRSVVHPEPSDFSARLDGDFGTGNHLIRFEGTSRGVGASGPSKVTTDSSAQS